MPKGFKHLTYEQRCQIYTLNERGDSFNQIAKAINVDPTTVGREINRNSGRRGYRYISRLSAVF